MWLCSQNRITRIRRYLEEKKIQEEKEKEEREEERKTLVSVLDSLHNLAERYQIKHLHPATYSHKQLWRNG